MSTQQVRAIVQIREMILRGELAPGERITEEGLAERLGMSRTPVRQALPALAREGLLTASETRGYFVRAFSEQDVLDAIDLRGLLEGTAARMLAERGPPASLLRDLHSCLAEGDGIFAKGQFVPGDGPNYAAMNARFHTLIVGAAGSKVIADAITANDRIPFAAAEAVAFDKMPPSLTLDLLQHSHKQHHAIVQALGDRQSMRVEMLFREHAQPVKDSLGLAHPHNASGKLFVVPIAV